GVLRRRDVRLSAAPARADRRALGGAGPRRAGARRRLGGVRADLSAVRQLSRALSRARAPPAGDPGGALRRGGSPGARVRLMSPGREALPPRPAPPRPGRGGRRLARRRRLAAYPRR